MLNNLVTSLELSKKLKELGVEQKSQFYWSTIYGPATIESIDTLNETVSGGDGWTFLEEGLARGHVCSAFTATELMEMMPTNCVLTHTEFGYKAYCTKFLAQDDELYTTPQEALGLLLVYLKENKIV